MFAGTGSDVGKSIVAAAFCRIFRQDGYQPAPFKAQNMALNSFVTPDGLEIGRAQAVQAEAAGIPCHTDMNPLLLKPQSDHTSQVVLHGKPIGNKDAYDYWRKGNHNSQLSTLNSQFELMVRYPGWVKPGQFAVKVNGQPVAIVTGPSSYVTIDRQWKKGDVVEINFPMYNYVKYMPNLPQYIALMHGPVMLAMKTGTEDLAMLIADDSRFGQLAVGKKLPTDQAPILINNNIEDIANQLQPVAGKPLHFTLSTKMVNEIRNELMPFFELHDSRYMMYWLALSEDNYQGYLDNLAKQEQERQALEDRTVDKVQPGEQQPESDHFMETDDSFVGNSNDVFYRDASNGHYFSYLMQTGGQANLSLRLKYWGVGEWKSHEFDIFVDDVLVTSVNNTGKYRISEFKYETYPVPEEALKGKKQVRVKFVAKPHRQIGEIYEVRLIR